MPIFNDVVITYYCRNIHLGGYNNFSRNNIVYPVHNIIVNNRINNNN